MPNAILLDVINCKWLNDNMFSPGIVRHTHISTVFKTYVQGD